MATVEVGRGFRNPKAHVVCRQVIVKPHNDRFPVPCLDGGTGENTVEPPNLILRQEGMETMIGFHLMDVIGLLREKLVPTLVVGSGCLSFKVVTFERGCRVECRVLGNRRGREGEPEWRGGRASPAGSRNPPGRPAARCAEPPRNKRTPRLQHSAWH